MLTDFCKNCQEVFCGQMEQNETRDKENNDGVFYAPYSLPHNTGVLLVGDYTKAVLWIATSTSHDVRMQTGKVVLSTIQIHHQGGLDGCQTGHFQLIWDVAGRVWKWTEMHLSQTLHEAHLVSWSCLVGAIITEVFPWCWNQGDCDLAKGCRENASHLGVKHSMNAKFQAGVLRIVNWNGPVPNCSA